MDEPKWISLEVIKALHQKQIQEHGGAPGLRDESLLLSALAKPEQPWSYTNPPPDICDLAAAYAFGLVKNHAFLDGNKRIAHMTYRLFLAKNKIALTASREHKYIKIIQLASGAQTQKSFAKWLRTVTSPA